MTAATGLKRLGFILLAVIAGGLAVLTTAGYLISADTVRQQVIAEIREVTGLDPVLRGKASVSLFPTGSVNFADVVLGDAKQPALTAERLTARLRFFPLLIGRVEIADVSLDHPSITIELQPNGQSNWSASDGSIGAQPDDYASARGIFRNAHRRRHRDNSRRSTETQRNIVRCGILVGLAVDLKELRRHRPLHLARCTDGREPDARRFCRRTCRQPQWTEAADLGRANEGRIRRRCQLQAHSQDRRNDRRRCPSLRNAVVWAGQKPLPGGGFGRFAIKARTNVVGGTISLSSVNVELDGNSAEGVLTFAADGRQTLQGTLAADTLDLTPYVSTVRLLAANERAWNNGRITLDGLAGLDLDLRLSAANVVVSNAKLGRTAIAANLRDGHLVVTVGEAQAYGGVIKGSMTLANFEQGRRRQIAAAISPTSTLKAASASCSACAGSKAKAIFRSRSKGAVTACSR